MLVPEFALEASFVFAAAFGPSFFFPLGAAAPRCSRDFGLPVDRESVSARFRLFLVDDIAASLLSKGWVHGCVFVRIQRFK